MTRFEDAVRHDLAAAPQPVSLSRLEHLTRRRRARRIIVGVVPLLLVAIGVGVLVRPNRRSSSVSVHPTVPEPTVSPSTVNHRDSRSTTPPARPLTSSRIELNTTTVVGGSSISAVVVVENDTGHAIRATGCGVLFQVVLTSPVASFDPGSTACAQVFTVPIGESRYPVTVLATYSACIDGKPQGDVKSCLARGVIPPLPAGEYRAVLYDPSHVVQPPAAPTVRVVNR